jgi:hypothetical protein
MFLRQTGQLAGAANTVERGKQPQGIQNRRRYWRTSGAAFDGLYPGIQRVQILPANKVPDHPRSVPFGQHRLQIARTQLNLRAVRL